MIKSAAIVVLFNPQIDEVLDNINAYKDAYNEVICVDNSCYDNSESFQLDKIVYVALQENTGIAYALNYGISIASKDGAEIITTFDQDTYLTSDSAQKLIESVHDKVISAPKLKHIYRDDKGNRVFTNEYIFNTEHPLWVITSGSTFNINTFKLLGGFDDKLFIAQVDYDFCFKLHKKGGQIIIPDNCEMYQELGSTIKKKLLFFGFVHIANLSPIRYYYIFRNERYLRKKYSKEYKPFHVKLYKYLASILLFEKAKISKIKSCLCGFHDALKI